MPFIHIRSLPFAQPLDVTAILKGVAADFAAGTCIEPAHIHVTWEFFRPGHYVKGERAPETQPEANFPLVVDLLTPDFNAAPVIELMLETLAGSLSARAGFPLNNIFINQRQAHSAMVFDDGAVVRW